MWQINPSENQFTILCKTFEGLEEVLKNEINALGFEAEVLKRAVQLKGNFNDVVKLNLSLRTALNVMIKVAEFPAKHPDELYKKAMLVDWHSFFEPRYTFSITHTIHSEHFSHSQFAALKLKDAVVDKFRNATGKRPSVDREDSDVVIHIRIAGDAASLWLDTSGKALYIRGYKTVNGPAPLNEVLAAGLVKLTGWDEKQPIFNPMCGGGTLGFEAFMMALGIPPSFKREKFAYHALPWFSAKEETQLTAHWQQHIHQPENFSITFSDMDIRAVDAVRKNARSFYGLGTPCMDFAEEDFFLSRPTEARPLILINPPYGERMEQDDLIGFYKQIGNTLKHHYAGHTAWVLSSALEEIKRLGLKPSRKIRVFNGPLEARWLQFKMYGFDEK